VNARSDASRLARFVFLILLGAGPAQAGTSTDPALTYLDSDAMAVVSVTPADLAKVFETSRRASPRLKTAITLVSVLTRGGLGFDITKSKKWGDAGFDPDRAIVVQLLALDETRAQVVFRDLWKTEKWSSPALRRIKKTYWRTRIVLPIRSGVRASAMLSKSSLIPDWYPVDNENAGDIAMMLGEPARHGERTVRSLTKSKIFAVGWIAALDTYVFARLAKKHIVVDLLGSFGGVPVTWARDKKALLSLVTRQPGNAGFVGRMSSGAARKVGGPGLVMWSHPQRLLAFGRALEWNAQLTRISQADSNRGKRRKVTMVPTECAAVDAIAQSGHLTDAALSVRTSARDVRARLTFGVRAKSPLPAVLKPKRAAVLDTAHLKKAAMAGVLRIGDLDGLRRLTRPKEMAAAWDKVWASAAMCGGGAATVLTFFGWPQTAAVFLDELVALDSTAKELIDGARVAAFALKRPGVGRDDTVGVAELALTQGASTVAERYLDVLFGDKKKANGDTISANVWGNGPLRPYLVSSGSTRVLGLGLGKRSIDWVVDQPRARTKGKTAPPLFELKGDLSKSLAPLASSDSEWSAVAKMLHRAIGPISARMQVDSTTIELSVDARLK
jgi:hypothetical protein